MVFTHDTQDALVAAVALVNSDGPPDALATTVQLRAFFLDHGYTGHHSGDEAELAAVRGLRPLLRTLLTTPRDEAVGLVNDLLREARALPQLVRHGDTDWHLHAVGSERPFAERIRVETAMAMVDVLREDELSRLGSCADPGCDGLVLDLSRNRSRRFCSTACSNRAAVAAYRTRQRVDR